MSYLSYEQQCEDFLHHGDPEQEAYLSEMNARYDYIKELEAENANNFCEDEQYEWLHNEEPPKPPAQDDDSMMDYPDPSYYDFPF